MSDTIVFLTKREHHELMHIAKLVQAAPARICFWAILSVRMLFNEDGQLPMLPRPYFEAANDEFRGYRRVRVTHDEWEMADLEKIAEKCRVSKAYIARLAVTQLISTIYRDGLSQGWVDLFKDDTSLETAPLSPERHFGSHTIAAGALSTLEERTPPNPR